MRSPSLKLKLTYKLDRKETQVPASSTFGDLKARRETPACALSGLTCVRHGLFDS